MVSVRAVRAHGVVRGDFRAGGRPEDRAVRPRAGRSQRRPQGLQELLGHAGGGHALLHGHGDNGGCSLPFYPTDWRQLKGPGVT